MFFDRRIPGTDLPAFHALDVRYVFGTFDVFKYQFEETDYRISQNIIDYFTNFARTGNPNGEGLPAWQPTTPTQKQVLTLGEQPTAMKKAPMWKMIRTMLTNKAVGE
jgi:para-nitrobenzyl esterase